MEKNSQDTSKKNFQHPNQLAYTSYMRPLPKYPKVNNFDRLVYVATLFKEDKTSATNFNHGTTSPFKSVPSLKNKIIL